MPAEMLDKSKNIIAGHIAQGDGKIEPHALPHGRDSNGAGHRQAVVAIPTGMERGFPSGCPRPTDRRLEHEATLIEKDDGTALTPGFF